MRTRRLSRGAERGMAIVLVLMTAFIGFLLVAGVLASSSTSSREVWRDATRARSEGATDAVLEAAVGMMMQDLVSPGGGVGVVSNNVAFGTYENEVLTVVTQRLTGAAVDAFSIASLVSTNYGEISWRITAQTEVEDPTPVPSRASLDLRMLDVPVTAFSLCYDVDLELYPWHDWTVNGPVYCGQTAYFCPTPDDTLTFAHQVFAVGGIIHEHHPLDTSGGSPGTIIYESEKNAQSPVMVQPPPPTGSTNRMRWILEIPATPDYGTPTGDQRFFNKADVVVTISATGTVEVRKGPKHGSVWVSSALPPGAYLANLQDGREARTANVLVLDASGVSFWMTSVFGAAAPAHPVIYVANLRTWGAAAKFSAVRVEGGVNGASFPANGFTLATPNPLYVRGDFNTFNTKPAMLAGDAVTLLSANWDDAGSGLQTATAGTTTLNAAVITGIVPAGGGFGSGWVANLIRLLENWDGRTLAFNGSLAVLYQSEVADGPYKPPSTYYAPPSQRTFSFTDYFSGSSQTNVPALKLALRGNYQQLTVSP